MKTIIKSISAGDLESVILRPLVSGLPFGAGYLRYLSAAATMDEEEPSSFTPAVHQPVRYLGAVKPMADGGLPRRETVGGSMRTQAPSLREAVISLRNKILAS